MSDKTRGDRRPLRAKAVAVVAAAGALPAACGFVHVQLGPAGGSAPGGRVSYAQELALAHCMRGHGLPGFPDPNPSGGFGSNVLPMVNSTQGQAAYGACRHLLASAPSLSRLQEDLQQERQQREKALPALLRFSQCVRGHGVPGFPGPSLNGKSGPAPAKGARIDPSSPRFQAAVRACRHLLPAGIQVSFHVSFHVSSDASRVP